MSHGPPPTHTWAYYSAVKAAVHALYEAQGPTTPIVLPYRPLFGKPEPTVKDVPIGTPAYDLNTCGRGGEFLGAWAKENDEALVFARIAYATVSWQDALAKLGYPQSVTQPAVAKYERMQVSEAIADPDPHKILADGSAVQLTQTLHAYRESHTGLPEAIWNSSLGCAGGGGGGYVNIATVPAGAQVLFIPMFFYRVCVAEKLNADNPSTCPNWREAIEGKLEQVEGDYMYRAHWSDGTVRRGELRFDTAQNDTITLRKP